MRKKNVLANIAPLVVRQAIRPHQVMFICFTCFKERKMKKILSLIAAVLIYPQISQGTECVNVPTCAEMGYTLTAPKGDGWICTACPTDPKKFSCSEKPCPPNSSTTQKIVATGSTGLCNVYCPKGYSGDKICYSTDRITVREIWICSESSKSHYLAICYGYSPQQN